MMSSARTDQPGDDLSARRHFRDMGQRAGGEADHRGVEQHGGEHLTARSTLSVRIVVRRQHRDFGMVFVDFGSAVAMMGHREVRPTSTRSLSAADTSELCGMPSQRPRKLPVHHSSSA